MSAVRIPVVAVVGSAGRVSREVESAAANLGRLVMEHGYRLATGGLDGVMAAASRGARGSDAWSDGRVLGVLPSYDRGTANRWCDLVIPTGAQLARNITLVAMADAVVALAGGAGTLSELALAWQLGKPIVAVRGLGGWADELAGRALDERHERPIHAADSPTDAMEVIVEWVNGTRSEPGAIGSGWRRGE